MNFRWLLFNLLQQNVKHFAENCWGLAACLCSRWGLEHALSHASCKRKKWKKKTQNLPYSTGNQTYYKNQRRVAKSPRQSHLGNPICQSICFLFAGLHGKQARVLRVGFSCLFLLFSTIPSLVAAWSIYGYDPAQSARSEANWEFNWMHQMATASKQQQKYDN